MSAIDSFPTTLVLRDQATFSLGYYHQRAENRASIHEAAEAKKAARSAGRNHGDDETNDANPIEEGIE